MRVGGGGGEGLEEGAGKVIRFDEVMEVEVITVVVGSVV